MFVAVWPDTATSRRLLRLDLGSYRGLRPTAPQQWHVTLRFFGEVDDDLLPPLRDALGEVATRCRGPLRCEAGPATAWFSGGRVLQLPVTGLDALARLVRAGTVPIVPIAAGGESPFVGHLTLGRARGRIDRSTRLGLEGIPFGATWTLSSIDLVASHRTPAGTRYTTLGRFPLRVRPGRALPGRDEPS